MSEKKLLNKEQLNKVSGGEIINNSSLEEKVEELRGIYSLLEERNKNAKSIQESMEIMNQMIEVMREIQGLEMQIENNKD